MATMSKSDEVAIRSGVRVMLERREAAYQDFVSMIGAWFSLRGEMEKEIAIDHIARRLFEKFEHIDPSGCVWDELLDQDRDMYRVALKYALSVPPEYIVAATS